MFSSVYKRSSQPLKLFLFFINVVKIYSLLLNQKRKYIISIRKVEYSHHLCVIFILGKINRYDLQHKSFFPQESRSTRRVTKWEIPGLFCLQLPLSLPLEERQWVKRLEMPRRPPHWCTSTRRKAHCFTSSGCNKSCRMQYSMHMRLTIHSA